MPRGRNRKEWRSRHRIESPNFVRYPNLFALALKIEAFSLLEKDIQKRLSSFISQVPSVLGELLTQPATQENLTQVRKKCLIFALKNNVQKALVHSQFLRLKYKKEGINLETAIVARLNQELKLLTQRGIDSSFADPSINITQYLLLNPGPFIALIQVWD